MGSLNYAFKLIKDICVKITNSSGGIVKFGQK